MADHDEAVPEDEQLHGEYGAAPPSEAPDADQGERDPGAQSFGPQDVADEGETAEGSASDEAESSEAQPSETDITESSEAQPSETDITESSEQRERDLVTERDALRDMLQRTQADFINFRKRATAQSTADVERATGRLAEALLPVLDAAEAAYLRHPDEIGPLLNAMLAELRKQGLESLDLEGKPFDPEVAEAVAHEPSEDDHVIVAEVLRSGYRWQGKTLRPAMVRTKG